LIKKRNKQNNILSILGKRKLDDAFGNKYVMNKTHIYFRIGINNILSSNTYYPTNKHGKEREIIFIRYKHEICLSMLYHCETIW
jgi:hypothetical protein